MSSPIRFSIELFFDEGAETAVRTTYDCLSESGLGLFLPEPAARPHVSLAVYDALDVSRAEAKLERFAAETPRLPFSLGSVGFFSTTEGVVFLAPVATCEFLNLHERFHHEFADVAASEWDYYEPGRWVPHCTLLMGVPRDLLSRALDVCLGTTLPIYGHFTSVGLVQFRPVNILNTWPLGKTRV